MFLSFMLEGGWAGCEPQKVVLGSKAAPVTIMLAVAGKIWCGCQNSVFVLNTVTLIVEVRIQIIYSILYYNLLFN